MIRRAEARDIPDILGLLVQVCMVHHEGRPDLFKGPATKFTAEELEAMIPDDSHPIFVLTDEDDTRVLGHAFCEIIERAENHVLTSIRTLYIHDLCVDEKYRGQMVGTRLYQYVLDFARSLGCYNVTLNVWACNPGAMRFYEQMGMQVQKLGMETLLES